MFVFFLFCSKQKTAYELRISDWSSDVCSSDLLRRFARVHVGGRHARAALTDEDAQRDILPLGPLHILERAEPHRNRGGGIAIIKRVGGVGAGLGGGVAEHLRAVESFGNGQHVRALYGARAGEKLSVNSKERRLGRAGDSVGRSGWGRYIEKKKIQRK